MTPLIMASYKVFYLLFISFHVCYELYPFCQSEAANTPSTNTTGSQGKGGISSGTIVAIVISISVAVLILIVGICCLCKRIWNKYDSESAIDISNLDSLQYDFRTIKVATNNFSADNKLGDSGFGDVYKGMLQNGQEIAVKRLHKSTIQGVQEFKNEVEVLARVRHKNLVRLLGFCVQGKERILVFEYVPNRSLDYILFDPKKRGQLDWTKRYKIIKGIAQGIQYLHEDSRLRIIHRDLKAKHVLLDSEINPKITDFGLAIVFTHKTEGYEVIAGTLGYLAPEYSMNGPISVKIDVYSFGVLLLEIISGKKNNSFHQMEGVGHLLSYAWKLWKNGEALELLDPTIRESCNPNEVMRCIHSVQEDPADRPFMSSIVLMLENYSLTLPTPLQPAFFVKKFKEEEELSTMESVY